MPKKKSERPGTALIKRDKLVPGYDSILSDIAGLLESARRAGARTVNAVMTATYWEIGRRIVEYEQHGKTRAAYGQQLLERLSQDLGDRFGRGFGIINLQQMRRFYLEWPRPQIHQTLSDEFSSASPSSRFPLPWSHYVKLLSVDDPRGARVL